MARNLVAGLVLGSIFSTSALYFVSNPLVSSTANIEPPCSLQPATQHPYLHPKIKVSDKAVWTTVQKIEESLKDTPPMNVGFDIDDTVLFPNTSFHVSYKKFCPNDNTVHRKSCVDQQGFWDHINRLGDLSPPKVVGKELIDMHKRRGDTIYFITAREKSKHKPETMTKTLEETFGLKDMHKVIYLGMATINTQKPGKTGAIKKHNVKIFYGDSDADIAAAKAANIRGIRVLRAPNSQDNITMPNNGIFGEEVIIGSDV